MEYNIITSTDKNEFVSKVNQHVNLGWQPLGSHQVITSKILNRGSDSHYNNEYSQTMVKGTLDIKEEVIHLLKTLKTDAEMALDGSWDCTTQEGIETGFNSQIDLIEKTLDKLK